MKNSDQPAFSSFSRVHTGLTKREYFAAMAMQGLCSDTNMTEIKTIITQSVMIADLMLTELEKTEPK